MAASRSMCAFTRNFRKFSLANDFLHHRNRRLLNVYSKDSLMLPVACEQYHRFMLIRFYSKVPTEPGGLTGDVLKAKVDVVDKKDSMHDSNNQENSEQKKEKSGGRFNKLKWAFGVGAICCLFPITIFLFGQEDQNEYGKKVEDEFSHLPWALAIWKRACKKISIIDEEVRKPTSQKLLPDPLPEPYYQPTYTLVIEINDVLIHPEWRFGTGWRYQKRPGVDYFLQQCASPLFEVVVYTSMPGYTAFPIINSLDPNGFITYRLFRDSTDYKRSSTGYVGTHIKDLSCLNRDLSKVIFVDYDANAFQKNPRNALKLKQWTGDREDRTLVDLATFLRAIAVSGVEDVRKVLDYYKQYDDPLEAFKEKQRELQNEMAKPPEQPKLANKWAPGLFGRK